ncbi:MAG TPA: hypothetical protein PKA64_20200 [Myxococcota bacterium]|nr:hypothetical protein [Myxococcota bacterium]
MRTLLLMLILALFGALGPPSVDAPDRVQSPLHGVIHRFPGVTPAYLRACDRRWDKMVVECWRVLPADGGPCTVAVKQPLSIVDPCQFECRCGGGVVPTEGPRAPGDLPPTQLKP